MCLGIPVRVVEPLGTSAWCEGRNGRVLLDLTIVGPQPAGAWLLNFLGTAREVLTPEAAEATNRALGALEAALAGETAAIDTAFADIIGREPELPEHLRRKAS